MTRLSTRDWLVSHGSISALGVFLIALGAIAVGWLPPLYDVSVNPLLEAMRLTEQGQLLGRTAVVLGGALLVHSWLVLGLAVLRDYTVTVHQLWALLAVWIAVLMFVPPLFSRDVYSYIAQGRLLVLGLDPYSNGVAAVPGWFQLGSDPMWAETPTPYGPLFLVIQHAIAAATMTSPTAAVVLFKITCAIGIALMATAVQRLAQVHGIDPSAATWLAVLNPLVVMHLFAGVHNDALMIGFMLWAFVFATNARFVPALLSLSAAVAIKPIALLALPFVALATLGKSPRTTRMWGAWALSAAVIGGVLYVLGAVNGVGFGWIGALSAPSAVATLLSPPTAIAEIFGLFTNRFGIDSYPIVLPLVRTGGLLLGLLAVAWLALRPYERSAVRNAALAFTAVVAFSPVVQPWYLLWVLPLVACSGLSRGWHLRVIVAGTAIFVMYSLSEVNVVTDSTIDISDYLSIGLSVAMVLLIAMASPSERALVWGTQFADGLAPSTAEEKQRASLRILERREHVNA